MDFDFLPDSYNRRRSERGPEVIDAVFAPEARRSKAIESDAGRFLAITHAWMALGLSVTGLTAWLMAQTGMAYAVATSRGAGIVLTIALLGATFALSSQVHRLSRAAAGAAFLGYAVLMSVSLSPIFLVYTGGSLAQAFVVTAGAFAALSIYGAVTGRDLGPVQSFMMMGLWGIIIAGCVNLFLHSAALQFVSSCVAVTVFSGLTAWNNQSLKRMYSMTRGEGNLAINGALMLYLNFINLFLALLNLFGNQRQRS